MRRFGATILDIEGFTLTQNEKVFFRDVNPFGFILFARNIKSAEQVRFLCGELREAVGHDALITIDQEGGRVQRLRPPLARVWPSPLDHVTDSGSLASRVIWLRYRIIAAELRRLGIDSNCAPVVDLAHENTHAFLYNRCLGTTVDQVVRLGLEAVKAHLEAGVLPVIKHVPGHGRAVIDSHYSLPCVDESLDTLKKTDFAVFRALTEAPMAMTAHVVFSALDEEPATLSRATMHYIRTNIGYKGLVLSDDIAMDALSGNLPYRSKQALAAGCDVVLCCNRSLDDRICVAEACGDMSEDSQMRAEAALRLRHSRVDIDIDDLVTELNSLVRARPYG